MGEIGLAPVLIADDDPGIRALLQETLEQHGYATAVADGGAAALELARRQQPTLALLDVNMPDLSGYEVCASLREIYGSELPIVFISGDRVEPFDRTAGLLIGADDYLVKPLALDELLARMRGLIRRAARGNGHNGDGNGHHNLTPREAEVLELLAQGLEQAEIAERLVISPKTVGTHIERILSKLGVRSRAQAVARAYRENLVARV